MSMKCKILDIGKNKKNNLKCQLLKFLPSMLDIIMAYASFSVA